MDFYSKESKIAVRVAKVEAQGSRGWRVVQADGEYGRRVVEAYGCMGGTGLSWATCGGGIWVYGRHRALVGDVWWRRSEGQMRYMVHKGLSTEALSASVSLLHQATPGRSRLKGWRSLLAPGRIQGLATTGMPCAPAFDPAP